MKKIILLIVMQGLCLALYAQNISSSNITWKATKDKDLLTGEEFQNQVQFITDKSNKIEMRVRASVQTFEIVSTSGSWIDITQEGSFNYVVSLAGQPGKITLQRNSEGIRLLLDMRQSDPEGIYREFTIERFEIN